MGFEVGYIEPSGEELRRPLADAWAVWFENAVPVREFKSYRPSGTGFRGLRIAAPLVAYIRRARVRTALTQSSEVQRTYW